MSLDYQEVLRRVFGFEVFRPGQEQIIKQILAGKSALAVFPTGSGKSLCYQLPALMLEGLTVVVSPLIALMKDQVDFLLERGIEVARLDSSLSAEEAREVYRKVRAGELKMLYVAPERIANERFFSAIEGNALSLMVVDEAHCISEWGHNFRPEYLKLSIAAKKLKVERVLALTATATPTVVEDILREFDIEPQAYVNTGFHRPNLHLSFKPTELDQRMEVLDARLKSTVAGPTVVYVTLQKTALEVAEGLSARGHVAKAYHAGMKNDVRAEIQDWFMGSENGIVVATIAFGMGIDKSNIRRVFHFNLPKTLENYSQEIGRAGRDGNASFCEVLGAGEDLLVLENFIYGDTPTRPAIEKLVDWILRQEDEFDLSVYHLSQQTDIRPLVLSTLLTYLELAGVLKFTAPFYSEYKFKYNQPKPELLALFKGEPGQFLESLLAQANDKKVWSYLNIESATARLNTDRARVVKAFNYLEEKGLLEVSASGLRQGMRMLERPEAESLVEDMLSKVQRNEDANLSRTRNVIDLLNSEECKTRYLLDYFGEKLEEPCGHCGYCQGDETTKVEAGGRELSIEERELVSRFKVEGPSNLDTSREAVRYLCGIASPKTSRAKGAFFGALVLAPFQRVQAEFDQS